MILIAYSMKIMLGSGKKIQQISGFSPNAIYHGRLDNLVSGGLRCGRDYMA